MGMIRDFPDEPRYTIKIVCEQTGIRPVTLRAWERRHRLLTPRRSENRYRQYSDRDVAILRWVKGKVDRGASISSAVAELHLMLRSGILPEPHEAIPVTSDETPEAYAQRLYQAVLRHDEPEAGRVLNEAQALFDLNVVCEQVISACMVEIGETWSRGETKVTTEHFASTFVRGKLLTMLQSKYGLNGGAYILVGCAPTEQHEIGSLMVAVLLRSQGYRVEYLGPNLPLDDLVAYAGSEHPEMICLSASSPAAALEMAPLQEKLSAIRPAPLFGYGGRAFILQPDLRQSVPGIFLGENLAQTVSAVRRLLNA
ncbi:MAG TPA: cobalamin-dependent protein [Anaerolineaceae bacterium]